MHPDTSTLSVKTEVGPYASAKLAQNIVHRERGGGVLRQAGRQERRRVDRYISHYHLPPSLHRVGYPHVWYCWFTHEVLVRG